jgi:hypothetical protein
MVDVVPTVVTAAVGVLLLAVLVVVLARHVRRFSRARARLGEDVRAGVARLRAMAAARRRRRSPGVDSGVGLDG